jgi:hypothetical protein
MVKIFSEKYSKGIKATYIVTEKIEESSKTLLQWVNEISEVGENFLPVNQILEIFYEISTALSYLHSTDNCNFFI